MTTSITRFWADWSKRGLWSRPNEDPYQPISRASIDSPFEAQDDHGKPESPFASPVKSKNRAAIIPFLMGFSLAITIGALMALLATKASSLGLDFVGSDQGSTPCRTENRDMLWAGAVLPVPPSGSRWYAATMASIVLPQQFDVTDMNFRDNRPKRIAATVGIGARSSKQAYLQAGVDIIVDPRTGNLSLEAWYQWWPDVRKKLPLDLSPGVDVAMEVVMFNKTTGKAVIRNDSQRQYNTQFLNPPFPEATLEGQDAEWILESDEDGELFDFGELSFRDCVAYTDDRVMLVAGMGNTYDMHYEGEIRGQVRSDNASVDVVFVS